MHLSILEVYSQFITVPNLLLLLLTGLITLIVRFKTSYTNFQVGFYGVLVLLSVKFLSFTVESAREVLSHEQSLPYVVLDGVDLVVLKLILSLFDDFVLFILSGIGLYLITVSVGLITNKKIVHKSEPSYLAEL